MNIASTASLPTNAKRVLCDGAIALGVELGTQQQEMLLSYLALMQKWNRVYNLTAIRDLDRMVSHHLLDSLSIAPHINARHVLDVGSGPGLPGIPLAVARPDLSVTMLDSNQKKTAFIQQALSELGLANAKVVFTRVESWQAPHLFDAIVSRAFADLSDFVGQARHLLDAAGEFVAMKGQRPDAEIARLPEVFRVKRMLKLAVPGLDAERHLVFIEAAQPT
jgi:16S rRNA (guanine527-N7)-methyltransferase